LSQQSLVFTNLYATGNRTVRGLEALTLCIPPTAGESIIKKRKQKIKINSLQEVFSNQKAILLNFYTEVIAILII
jgi:membrane-anchored protein YejM (alkaline phosphatase superfamily)